MYDTTEIYLNDIPFGDDHYRENFWMIMLVMNLISKLFFFAVSASFLAISIFGSITIYLHESLTIPQFIILIVDILIWSFYLICVAMIGLFMGMMVIIFTTIEINDMMTNQVRKLEECYRRLSSNRGYFFMQMDRTRRMYCHLLKVQQSADSNFVQYIFTILAILTMIYNAFSMASYVKDPLTKMAVSHIIMVNVVLYGSSLSSAQLLFYTSNVLLKPRRVLFSLFASKHSRMETIGFYRLMKYVSFLHITNHKRPFRFHFSLFCITQKNIFSLLLGFASIVMLIVSIKTRQSIV